jgi:hypothetical protein
METLQSIETRWRELGFTGKQGFRLYTCISFLLCLVLTVKFFGFDRTLRCSDVSNKTLQLMTAQDLCAFKMLIVLFSLAYSTLHLFALLFGSIVLQKLSKSSNQDVTPLALASAGKVVKASILSVHRNRVLYCSNHVFCAIYLRNNNFRGLLG